MGYKIISKKIGYKRRWLTVKEVKLKLPTGKIVDWIAPEMNDFVAILPLDKNRNIYLVKEWRLAWEKEVLQIPAGSRKSKNNKAEAILKDAKRELKEETGLIAKRWQKLLIVPHSSRWRVKGTIYLARKLTLSEQQLDETEFIDVVKMPFKKAWNLLFSGKLLTNSYTLLGMAYVKEKLKL